MKAWTQLKGLGPALFVLALVSSAQLGTAAPYESEQSTEIEYYPVADATGCYYNFEHYDEGDRIITNEPCLNCTCHNRMLMCYLRVCPFTKAIGQDCKVEKKNDQCCPVITCPEVPVQLVTHSPEQSTTALGHLNEYGCSIDGLFYADGAKVPSNPSNPCEVCYCIRNRTACIIQDCTLRGKVVEGCEPVYVDGVCCPLRYDCDHPQIETTPRPLLTTTTTTTTTTIAPTTVPTDCIYKNEVHLDGSLLKNDVPCEKCYCMKGDIVCAVQECGPTPLDKVNCTALPAKEGQCCPDTYDCEQISEEDLTTISSFDVTTLQPSLKPSKEDTILFPDDEEEEDKHKYPQHPPTESSEKEQSPASTAPEERLKVTTESITESFTEAVTSKVTELISAVTSTFYGSSETTEPVVHDKQDTEEGTASPSIETSTEEKSVVQSGTSPSLETSSESEPPVPAYDDGSGDGQITEEPKVQTTVSGFKPELTPSSEAGVKETESTKAELEITEKSTERFVSFSTSQQSVSEEHDTEKMFTTSPVVEGAETTQSISHTSAESGESEIPSGLIESSPVTESEDNVTKIPETPQLTEGSLMTEKVTEKPQMTTKPVSGEKCTGENCYSQSGDLPVTEEPEIPETFTSLSDDCEDSECQPEEEITETPTKEISEQAATMTPKTESKPDVTKKQTEDLTTKPSITEKQTFRPITEPTGEVTTKETEIEIITSVPTKETEKPPSMDHVSENIPSQEESHTLPTTVPIEMTSYLPEKTSDENIVTTPKEFDSNEIPDVEEECTEKECALQGKEPITKQTTESNVIPEIPPDVLQEPVSHDCNSEDDDCVSKHVEGTTEIIDAHSPEVCKEGTDCAPTLEYEKTETSLIEETTVSHGGPTTSRIASSSAEIPVPSIVPTESEQSSERESPTTVKEIRVTEEHIQSTKEPFLIIETEPSIDKETQFGSSSAKSEEPTSVTTVSHKDITELQGTTKPVAEKVDDMPEQLTTEEYVVHVTEVLTTERGVSEYDQKSEQTGRPSSESEEPQQVTSVPVSSSESATSTIEQETPEITTEIFRQPEHSTGAPYFTKSTPSIPEKSITESLSTEFIEEQTAKPEFSSTHAHTEKQEPTVVTLQPSELVTPQKGEELTTSVQEVEPQTETEVPTLVTYQSSEIVTPQRGEESTTLAQKPEILPTQPHPEKEEPTVVTQHPSEYATAQEGEELTTLSQQPSQAITPQKEGESITETQKQETTVEEEVTKSSSSWSPESSSPPETSNEIEPEITTAAISKAEEPQVTTPTEKIFQTTVPSDIVPTTKREPGERYTEANVVPEETTHPKYPEEEPITYATTTPQRSPDENTTREYGIPGEGNCLVDGQTYKNNSEVPPVNQCQLACKCVSSILQCQSVPCEGPPNNMQNCVPIFHSTDSCCPTYSCSSPGVTSMESDSHIMETTTDSKTLKTEDKETTYKPSDISEETTLALTKATHIPDVQVTTVKVSSEDVEMSSLSPETPTSLSISSPVPGHITGTPVSEIEVSEPPVVAHDCGEQGCSFPGQSPSSDCGPDGCESVTPPTSATFEPSDCGVTGCPSKEPSEQPIVIPETSETYQTEIPIIPHVSVGATGEQEKPTEIPIAGGESTEPTEELEPEKPSTKLPGQGPSHVETEVTEKPGPSEETTVSKAIAVTEPQQVSMETTNKEEISSEKPVGPSSPPSIELTTVIHGQIVTKAPLGESTVMIEPQESSTILPVSDKDKSVTKSHIVSVTPEIETTEHSKPEPETPTEEYEQKIPVSEGPTFPLQPENTTPIVEISSEEITVTNEIITAGTSSSRPITIGSLDQVRTSTQETLTSQSTTGEEEKVATQKTVSDLAPTTKQPVSQGHELETTTVIPSKVELPKETIHPGVTELPKETESSETTSAKLPSGAEATEASKESETPKDIAVTEATKETQSSVASEVTSVPKITIATDLSKATEVPTVTESSELPEGPSEPPGETESSKITELPEGLEITGASKISEIPATTEATKTSGGIEIPKSSEAPKETESWAVTGPPQESEATEISRIPGETEIPRIPGETEWPKSTELPKVTESSKSTELPNEPESTKPTEALGETESPKTSAEPDITKSEGVGETESSKVSDVPSKTESSKATVVPSVTESPEDTEVPSETESPKGTAIPSEIEPSKTPKTPTGTELTKATESPYVTEAAKETDYPLETKGPQEITHDITTAKSEITFAPALETESPSVTKKYEEAGAVSPQQQPIETHTTDKELEPTEGDFPTHADNGTKLEITTLPSKEQPVETTIIPISDEKLKPSEVPPTPAYPEKQNDTEPYTSGPKTKVSEKPLIAGELSTSVPMLQTSTTESPTLLTSPHIPHQPEMPVDMDEYPEYPEQPDEGPLGPGTCRYGGKVYVSAQQIPRDDPCDFCFCFRSDIICLQQSCPPPIPNCHEEPIKGFCCPRYECPVSMATSLNLTTSTTTTTTTLPPHFFSHAYKGRATRNGCQIQGRAYRVGEVVKSASGPCMHCTCGGDGQMKCDPKACSPEPMLRQMIAAAASRRR